MARFGSFFSFCSGGLLHLWEDGKPFVAMGLRGAKAEIVLAGFRVRVKYEDFRPW